MGAELSAEDLLARVAQGDVNALSELYDRHAPCVYGIATHILRTREAAEATLKKVFMRLWAEGPRLRQEGISVVAWLVVSTREAAVDRFRVQGRVTETRAAQPPSGQVGKGSARKLKAPVRPPSAATPSDGDGVLSHAVEAVRNKPTRPEPTAWLPFPREIALIDDRLPLLHKALDQLPKAQQQALELAVFAGLSELQIAAETGEPLGKVQRSLRAAVTFVRQRRRAVCGKWAANI